MRVVPFVIVAGWGLLLLAGCSSTNRRSAGGGGEGAPFLGAGQPKSARPNEPVDPLALAPGPAPNLDGILAGQALDAVTGRLLPERRPER